MVRFRPTTLLGALLALILSMALPTGLLAGPVEWISVGTTAEGEQWWDAGSLRVGRGGQLTVLSRFRPAAEGAAGEGDGGGRPKPGSLYVMDLDCGQALYRDTAIGGWHQFGAEWQPVGGDPLIAAVLTAACEAGAPLLAAR
ncbi:hypothetical protein [Cyanobium sp. Morenito 9A2]|uniref:hypothetical protein n=1 Tax=Cyanobium sp. Morenito 9A2 TaxID=2823718 RepID=UPI0020CD9006|nr:hypothetical protein [Cyanobium sp. Morenito 9A2]MCP9848665.1 hypothetical protein [Cyanobium sp. Morenito 9A2]